MRVLLVEDHAKLATTLARGLRREGIAVDVVFDGDDALAHVAGTDTTWWYSTGTCPRSMATRFAGRWSRTGAAAGS